MELFTVFLIALGLSMDAFAVALCCGAGLKKEKHKTALRVGLFFGIFQALMPLIGFKFGFFIKEYFDKVDHWIAFSLLAGIGGKMIYESFKSDNCEKGFDISKLFVILSLSVATSIDALVAGLSLALIGLNVYFSIGIIGITTFLFSYFGVFMGEKFSCRWGSKAELIGGIILIIIGLKTLLEHIL
ncbi:MAG: manganese efflux pump MntP family protein [Bacteroidota bacterium]